MPLFQQGNAADILRLRYRLQERVDIRQVRTRQYLFAIRRHRPVGRAHEGFERLKRQLGIGQHLAIAGDKRPLPLEAVALPAAVRDESLATVLGRCSLRGGIAEQTSCDNERNSNSHDFFSHRGWVQTFNSAGWPDLTTAMASLMAGPRSAGSLIGPLAHQPIDSASL